MSETYSITVGLVSRVVPNGKVGMLEGLFTADTSSWVEAKHAREQINRKRVGLREQG